jgi:hypothetical protein
MTEKMMKLRFLAPLLVVVPTLAFAGFNPLEWLLRPKDATDYATKMAATIQDKPECLKFKQEIMAHAKGSMADGKTITPIVQAKMQAGAAGCTK